MIGKILNSKKFRFLIGGMAAVAFNISAVVIMIEFLGFKSPFLKNVANILAMEIGTIASFIIYRFWVWEPMKTIRISQIFNQFLIYHLTLGVGIATRSFIIFPILDLIGINYVLNVAIGILVFTVINYSINTRIFN